MTQPQRLQDALSVVTDPETYANRPSLRLAAWTALMAARGNHVVQHRLNRHPQHPAGPRTCAMRAKLMNPGAA